MTRLITALSLAIFGTYGLADLLKSDEAQVKLCQSYSENADYLFKMEHKTEGEHDNFIMCSVNDISGFSDSRKIFTIHSKPGFPNEIATYVGEMESSFDKRIHVLKKINAKEESELLIFEVMVNEEDGKLEAKLHFHDHKKKIKTAKYSTSLFAESSNSEQ